LHVETTDFKTIPLNYKIKMTNIVFASNNENKIIEVADKIKGSSIHIIGLPEINCHDDIPETQATIVGNALQKAEFVKENYGYDCFAEDTGLEIDGLNGKPGVHTARYAGETRDTEANMNLVLAQLANTEIRTARFRTVVALIYKGETHTFEGVCNGQIATQKSGEKGFGYDPIFIPDGYTQTFAELSKEIKNTISHRAKAIEKLIAFFESNEA
jgi:XTP/dITP diphosphohydrolase